MKNRLMHPPLKTPSFRSALLGTTLAFVLIGGCSPGHSYYSVTNEFKEITAERIARPAFMVERSYTSNGMDIKLWERMHASGHPANIYIEGDGNPTFLNTAASGDPTPTNPVALHLASRDNAANVGYLARPCQFRESPDHTACPPRYWSNERYGKDVMAAYNALLDNIRKIYGITGFNLIGYDGGANLAAAIAAERTDVLSLRTVAGNLHPDLVYEKSNLTLEPDRASAFDVAEKLAKIPQHHFVGSADDVTPPSIYHSFRQKMGESDCVRYTFVPDADHTLGWVEKWPELLKSAVACEEPHPLAPLPPVPSDLSHGMK